MSGANADDAKKHELPDKITQQDEAATEVLMDDQKQWDENYQKALPSASNLQEEMVKKKYGGMLPKKPPLISKDHEHAFFDSADWALGKQGSHKPKGPLEILRPKLQPTAHHQVNSRLSAYSDDHAPAASDMGKDVMDDVQTKNATGDTDDQDFTLVDGGIRNAPIEK